MSIKDKSIEELKEEIDQIRDDINRRKKAKAKIKKEIAIQDKKLTHLDSDSDDLNDLVGKDDNHIPTEVSGLEKLSGSEIIERNENMFTPDIDDEDKSQKDESGLEELFSEDR